MGTLTEAKRGRLITFEGIDGSGKTTQIQLLHQWLDAEGYDVLILREPGGTPIGEQIRDILLSVNNTDMSAVTELLLFEAARAQLVKQVIAPALDEGRIVICDRFMDSTVAYQGYGRGLDPDLVDRLNLLAVGDILPDLTIWLDAPDDALFRRISRRKDGADRLDREKESFRQRTIQGFLKQCEAYPERIRRIDTSGSKEETAKLIEKLVRRTLP